MKAVTSAPSSKRILWWMTSLLGLYFLLMLNWIYEVLRFSFDPLNYFFFLVVLSIPIVVFVMSLRLSKTSWKLITITCLIPLLLGSVGLGFFTAIVIPDVIKEGQPALRRRLRTVPSEYYNLGVYFNDYIVTIRQEKEVLPGILLVRQVYLTPGTDVGIEVVDTNRVKVTSTIDPASSDGKILSLKRFVYL